MSIKVLPDELISQIAAGEVVERPASVVKELVENSLDAGARHVTIEIEKAGKSLIRVTDDGCGMSEEEIKLALLRHSTSKISSLDDLFNISSLGFRGEALPSIASISKLRIDRNKSGAGLTVIVRDLFYNTPARLKFLKSDPTEAGQIADLVLRLVLSRPEVAFKYIVDGKTMIESSGNGKLKDAILAVYGLDITRDLMEISLNGVSGFISKPSLSRVDRNYESFYINGRLVRNYLLSRALEDAYQSLIPRGRYPIAILTLNIPPKEVDVNVHPSKREVKFLKTQQVMGAVYSAVDQALKKLMPSEASLPESFPRMEPGAPQMMFDLIREPVKNEEMEFMVSEVQPLLPVYQYLDTFIIATDGVDLAIIDQHAAHERVIFDRLNSKEGTVVSQDLLISENVEFAPDKSVLLKENLEYFKGLGFEIEEFGANTFMVRAVPAVLKCSPRDVLQDILDSPNLSAKKNDEVLKLIACHAAVKAGDKLSREEMDQLIRDLYQTRNPLTCPHGRPTMIKFREGDLYKMFGR